MSNRGVSSRWTRFLWLGEALGISSLAADVENKKAREITGFDEESLRVLVIEALLYSHSIMFNRLKALWRKAWRWLVAQDAIVDTMHFDVVLALARGGADAFSSASLRASIQASTSDSSQATRRGDSTMRLGNWPADSSLRIQRSK